MAINLTNDIKVGNFNYLSRFIGYGNIPDTHTSASGNIACIQIKIRTIYSDFA